MSKLKLKVCGLRDNAQEVIDTINPDLAGFIYYKNSPRFIGDLAVGKIDAKSKVGVFVNEEVEQIRRLINKDHLDYVQLHGDESIEDCRLLQQNARVIKVFAGNKVLKQEDVDAYADVIDFYLFDTRNENFGGTGRTFNWQNLNQLNLRKPLILSGGIGLSEAEKVLNLKELDIYAIDVNSQFEEKPGLKNLEMLRSLKEKIQ